MSLMTIVQVQPQLLSPGRELQAPQQSEGKGEGLHAILVVFILL